MEINSISPVFPFWNGSSLKTVKRHYYATKPLTSVMIGLFLLEGNYIVMNRKRTSLDFYCDCLDKVKHTQRKECWSYIWGLYVKESVWIRYRLVSVRFSISIFFHRLIFAWHVWALCGKVAKGAWLCEISMGLLIFNIHLRALLLTCWFWRMEFTWGADDIRYNTIILDWVRNGASISLNALAAIPVVFS